MVTVTVGAVTMVAGKGSCDAALTSFTIVEGDIVVENLIVISVLFLVYL